MGQTVPQAVELAALMVTVTLKRDTVSARDGGLVTSVTLKFLVRINILPEFVLHSKSVTRL